MLLIPIIDILQGQSGRGPWPLAHNPQLLGAEHTLLVPHGVLQIAVRSERVYIYNFNGVMTNMMLFLIHVISHYWLIFSQ